MNNRIIEIILGFADDVIPDKKIYSLYKYTITVENEQHITIEWIMRDNDKEMQLCS